ncbi:MAG: hypothetical protein GXO75_14590 [Calditrichaeota bacterium]|nr:hypothetical protein [Calditrichota bacterium]
MSKRSAIIFTALILGLGWAIRGHFGHEHGAAWAGAMGALAIIVASKRKDWALRLAPLAVLTGIGWGAGGMMSYGIIVGIGRGTDFANVYYGLAMLGVIGGLYGFLGGGLFGLGLESTNTKKPAWASLFTEMIAGGLLAWYVLIAQFEWKMTPPRSELWAACFGASLALAWFLYRNGFHRALRVAGYSALGAGFGFAFGNFLQTMGNVTGLSFNWWNVMEFTLGFCGGLGMAYGVFTREWPESIAPSKAANWLALLFLLFVIPGTNIIQSMELEDFVRGAERMGMANPLSFAHTQVAVAWLVVLIFVIGVAMTYKRFVSSEETTESFAPFFLFAVTIYYLIFSEIKKLLFFSVGVKQLEQYLYWVILFITLIMWLRSRGKSSQAFIPSHRESWKRWISIIALFLIVLAVTTFISIHSHGSMPGAHTRF